MNKLFFGLGFCLFCILFFSQPVFAAHYIVGKVENASDGTSANGKTVVLWNPAVGIQENVTDTIGTTGNSGVDNYYMIDCELFGSPCNVGDLLSVKVLNSGDNHFSKNISVTVTGAGYDLVGDLRLNSPPNAAPRTPVNQANVSSLISLISFNCSASDLDSNLANITLYGNWSGGWHANETKSVSGNFSSTTFEKNLSEGIYKWGCFASDDLSVSAFSTVNYTLTVDLTKPSISSIEANISSSCQDDYARVNCTVNDALSGIGSVILEAIAQNGRKNYTASLISGNTYYADILLNETGSWKFNCIVNDSAGNSANLTSSGIFTSSTLPDLFIKSEYINFSRLNPAENEAVIINATIYNLGCGNANNVLVGFYEGNPGLDGININNRTLSVAGLSNSSVFITWNAKIGKTNIFVFADTNSSVNEENESNNIANNSVSVFAWQEFYGNISMMLGLPNLELNNLTSWDSILGLVFVSDTESSIDWTALQAIGRDSNGETTSNDFSDMDSLLGMSSFDDSVSSAFTTDGNTPRAEDSFRVRSSNIENVPIVDSTDNSNFVTGILWDKSDDHDDEYSIADKEDLIFATKINKNTAGKYGVYDYEIKIPAKLREYDTTTNGKDVYFYYEIN